MNWMLIRLLRVPRIKIIHAAIKVWAKQNTQSDSA